MPAGKANEEELDPRPKSAKVCPLYDQCSQWISSFVLGTWGRGETESGSRRTAPKGASSCTNIAACLSLDRTEVRAQVSGTALAQAAVTKYHILCG